MGSEDTDRLTTQQVADRLGVKPETVYAYASRGLLTSERVPGTRGSTFSAREVDELVTRGRRGRPAPAPAAAPEDRLATVRTAITSITGGRLYYRGVDAVELSERHGFEAAVGWLWGTGTDPGVPLRASAPLVAVLERVGAALPPGIRLTDRLRVSVAAAASADPLRFDLREENVLATAAALIGSMVDSLPPTTDTGTGTDTGDRLAARLWNRLAPGPPPPGAVDWLDRALVLLADHDLAVSTLAVRVAASARADPYAVVSAGLGALDSPLHGAASGLAHRMLGDVLAAGNAALPMSEYLRTGLPVPGLGQRLYPDGDPRGHALLAALRRLPWAAPTLTAVDAVLRTTADRPSLAANVDLALAAFTSAAQMPPEAGELLFATARTAGWIAHTLEEYREPPLRMRTHGVYTGPVPNAPAPEDS